MSDSAMAVQLCPFRPEHAAALRALTLPAAQAEFTTHPAGLLDSVPGDPQRQLVTILRGGEVVGAFVLAVGEHRDRYLTGPDPDAVALSSLSVDAAQQGRGVGTAAMRALPGLVRALYPLARRVILIVNQRNPGARHVYGKAGFQVTATREGRIGPQWVMTLPLN